ASVFLATTHGKNYVLCNLTGKYNFKNTTPLAFVWSTMIIDIDKYCMFAQHQIMKGWWLSNSSFYGLAVSFSSSMGIIGDGKILNDCKSMFLLTRLAIGAKQAQEQGDRQFSLVAGHIRVGHLPYYYTLHFSKTIDCRDAASKKQSIHRILQRAVSI
ncbi:hypothetical protein ACJX0J_024474, partial [Zea mays]